MGCLDSTTDRACVHVRARWRGESGICERELLARSLPWMRYQRTPAIQRGWQRSLRSHGESGTIDSRNVRARASQPGRAVLVDM
jgi:hypothetical protein